MEQATITPLETFLRNELSKPGLVIMIYGTDENGMPYEQKIAQVYKQYFPPEDSNAIRYAAEGEQDPEKKRIMLNFANSGDAAGRKLMVKTSKMEYASMTHLQNQLRLSIQASKELPKEFQTYKELKEKMFDGHSDVTDEEMEQYHELHEKLGKLPANKIQEVLTDEERYAILRGEGVKFKPSNDKCTNQKELDLLRIHRRLLAKERRKARK